MRIIKYIILLLVLSITCGGQAQKSLSLSDAIALGLQNNYDLQITRMSEEVASINNSWGNTGALPSVNFDVTGRENFNYNDTEDYRTQTISPDMSLNWLVFNGFSAKITKQKLEVLEQQSQGNTAVLVESTIQNILVAYNNCLLQKEMVGVYKQLSDLSEDRYKRAADSRDLGASTSYEMLQAKTAWLEDQSNYLQQKVNFENAIRTLNFNMAVEDDVVWELTSPLQMDMPDYLMEDLSAKLLSNNKTLKNQYLYQSLQAKEIALAKSNVYPSLSLNTGVGKTWTDHYYSGISPDVNQNTTDAYVGLTLSFNIFNGGVTRRSIQIAKINEEAAQVETGQMEHSLKNQLLQLYSNYNVQKALLKLANEKESTAKLNLDLSEEKFKNGSINSFNYRDVQIVYMNAAIARFQAIFNLIQSNTELLRLTGGIVEEFGN
ncbi:TolC family protein [Saccharicrinis fermentans]|uniref:Outer membrane efflux protein BepC n=1 Tax=Saccharicrinis fermentans DSM 9555 = JCM 21142 TaxID=869213 RepID=W7YE96_9BACT|nr:TolC family protein [Saccharicrinis fermentans]GAF05788.1 outer membrane efflux protein BepC precursor [Saccharicrinis fermentans DSM 9555 = JCM 21142]